MLRPVLASALIALMPTIATAAPTGRAFAPPRLFPWPIQHPHLVRGADIPAADWLPGHRGVDVAAAEGSHVSSPFSARVRFSGVVAGRPVVSLEDADGLVITLEPVVGVHSEGVRVAPGESVGVVGRGGHCDSRCVHVGVLLRGRYLEPTEVFELPRVRLKPWS